MGRTRKVNNSAKGEPSPGPQMQPLGPEPVQPRPILDASEPEPDYDPPFGPPPSPTASNSQSDYDPPFAAPPSPSSPPKPSPHPTPSPPTPHVSPPTSHLPAPTSHLPPPTSHLSPPPHSPLPTPQGITRFASSPALPTEWLTSLRQEIAGLLSEKAAIQQTLQALRSQEKEILSDRQLGEQQQWASQFAQILAQHVRQELIAQLSPTLFTTASLANGDSSTLAHAPAQTPPAPSASYPSSTEPIDSAPLEAILATLEERIRLALEDVRQDLENQLVHLHRKQLHSLTVLERQQQQLMAFLGYPVGMPDSLVITEPSPSPESTHPPAPSLPVAPDPWGDPPFGAPYPSASRAEGTAPLGLQPHGTMAASAHVPTVSTTIPSKAIASTIIPEPANASMAISGHAVAQPPAPIQPWPARPPASPPARPEETENNAELAYDEERGFEAQGFEERGFEAQGFGDGFAEDGFEMELDSPPHDDERAASFSSLPDDAPDDALDDDLDWAPSFGPLEGESRGWAWGEGVRGLSGFPPALNHAALGWVAGGLPGVMAAIATMLLLSVNYSIVEVLFRGAPWLAGDMRSGAIVPTVFTALLTLWIRLFMALLLIVGLGRVVYPPLIDEAQNLLRLRDRRPLIALGLSGVFFFVAQWLLYLAIGRSSMGSAVTLFYLYPAGVVALGGLLMAKPLSPLRWGAIAMVVVGVILTSSQVLGSSPPLAIASGLSFALYALLTGFYSRKLHPLSVLLVQTIVAWGCASPALIGIFQVQPRAASGYVIGCLLLGVTAVGSYLLNSISLRRLGAATTTLLTAWVPLVVLGLERILFNPSQTSLQWLGAGLITLSIVILHWERFWERVWGRSKERPRDLPRDFPKDLSRNLPRERPPESWGAHLHGQEPEHRPDPPLTNGAQSPVHWGNEVR